MTSSIPHTTTPSLPVNTGTPSQAQELAPIDTATQQAAQVIPQAAQGQLVVGSYPSASQHTHPNSGVSSPLNGKPGKL
jgi:hypothetical protein